MLRILNGMRPKKPIFVITRGYTEGLWEMTTTCWEKDPTKRPAVDHVLGVLRSAAGQWEHKCGELATQDDWSPASSPVSLTEESDSEHESYPSANLFPYSKDSFENDIELDFLGM